MNQSYSYNDPYAYVEPYYSTDASDWVPSPPVPGSFQPHATSYGCAYYEPHLSSKPPISALALHDSSALFVAGHCVREMSRLKATPSHSSLAVHLYPEGTLYSACLAHPEAPTHVLHSIATSIFGGSTSIGTRKSHNSILRVPPPHAYIPCFGFGSDFDKAHNSTSSPWTHFGIHTILPFDSLSSSSNRSNDKDMDRQHFACSISPSSIHLHSIGGLQISSSPIQGMMAGTFNPTQNWENHTATHVTVGGVSVPSETGSSMNMNPQLHCLDLYTHGLPSISSCNLRPHEDESIKATGTLGVTKIVTLNDRNSMVAGCSDGTIRILDGGWRSNNLEAAKMKAHSGGVTDVAVQGNLICTCGYTSRGGNFGSASSTSGSWYAFPDTTLYVFDIRYLGRGGVPHPFRGYKGGPRFVTFLDPIPEDANTGSGYADGRILVASGQTGGGLEIITPFQNIEQESHLDPEAHFLHPDIDPTTEAITCMSAQELDLVVGTSQGNVLQYRRLSDHTPVKTRLALSVPPMIPDPPALSIDPFLLLNKFEDKDERRIEKSRQSYAPLRCKSIFNSYISDHDHLQLSRFGYDADPPGVSPYYSFGPLSENPFVPHGRRILSKKLQEICTKHVSSNNDFLCTIPVSQLGIDILSVNSAKSTSTTCRANPNKLLYTDKLKDTCYLVADPRSKENITRKKSNYHSLRAEGTETDEGVPRRYGINGSFRSPHSILSALDFAALNESIYPGWDYAPFRPNSFFPPILLLLYFTPEIRNAIDSHHNSLFLHEIDLHSSRTKDVASLLTELGFLFHQIDSISAHAHTYSILSVIRPIVTAFIPTNFLSALSISSEVSALALLDGSPAAAEQSRRPEAFYRFFVHHLDKELLSSKTSQDNNHSVTPHQRVIDSLQGIDFTIVNIIGKGNSSNARPVTGLPQKKVETGATPKVSIVRPLSVEMAYEPFLSDSSIEPIDFGAILAYSLCKVVRLRAWNNQSKTFETVVQGKTVTSLPKLLNITCACAGKQNNEGLSLWRQVTESEPWLPEIIEIDIVDFAHVRVRQLALGNGGVVWKDYDSRDSKMIRLDQDFSKAVDGMIEGKDVLPVRKRYRLEAVLSFIRDGSEKDLGVEGHHVLHVRVPTAYLRRSLNNQLTKVRLTSSKNLGAEKSIETSFRSLGIVSQDEWNQRADFINNQLVGLDGSEVEDTWLLFNGTMVSVTTSDDARAFHEDYKEPGILYYREIISDENVDPRSELETANDIDVQDPLERNSQHQHLPLTDISQISFNYIDDPPGVDDLIAFDAEFVQVQPELSLHSTSGQKRLIHEGRNALARISLIDCRSSRVLCDHYVRPLEPVTDYLTRFSGIRLGDLDPTTTSYQLISHRSAYLQIRFLVDRGCIFVGHGLSQDFSTLNVFVPPAQVIDTLSIYHLVNRRYISLRFLVNYFLNRDMQQDTHDSIEDARAAYDLYLIAVELTKEGKFKQKLIELYEYGERIDWKIGVLVR